MVRILSAMERTSSRDSSPSPAAALRAGKEGIGWGAEWGSGGKQGKRVSGAGPAETAGRVTGRLRAKSPVNYLARPESSM